MAVVVGVIVIGFIGLNPNPAFVGPTPDPTSPALGIVIAVDSAGLANVRGFTLRDSDSGSAFTFKLGPLDNATEFSPSHLSEHLASSEPIRVFFRLENGELVAHRIEDASGG